MDDREKTYELSLQQLLRLVLRNKVILIISFVVCVALAFIMSEVSDPVYSASAEIMLREGGSDLFGSLASGELGLAGLISGGDSIERQTPWILSTATMQSACTLLASDKQGPELDMSGTPSVSCSLAITREQLRQQVNVTTDTKTGLITITAEHDNPTVAACIANAILQAYSDLDRERATSSVALVRVFLEGQIGVVEGTLASLESELVIFQERTGLLLQESLITGQLTKVEQLLIEATVNIEDRKTELDSIEKLLESVSSVLLEKVTSTSEGTPLLLELRDKINYMLRLQNEIADLESDRLESLRNESYAEAKVIEIEILNKKDELEADAARQYTILDLLPEYEELITRQLQLALEIKALENRIGILANMRDEQKAILLTNALELARRRRELDVGESVYSLLLDQYHGAQIAEAAQQGTIDVVNWAEAPSAPISPRKKLNLAIGGFLGIMLGFGGIAIREGLISTIRTKEEVELHLPDVPFLGSIPEIKHSARKWQFAEVRELLLTHIGRMTPAFQAFTSLDANLRFVLPDSSLQSLAVTSATPNEGKSTISANLALTIAHSGKRVVLVDTDFRRPVLAEVFELGKNLPGLSDVVTGQRTLDSVIRQLSYKDFGDLAFIPAGSSLPNPNEILTSERLVQIIEQLEEQFDLVILDTPPVTVGPDARILGRMADGVLVVVRAAKTRREIVRDVLRLLTQSQTHILGTVLNRAPDAKNDEYNYYAYYASSEKEKRTTTLLDRIGLGSWRRSK